MARDFAKAFYNSTSWKKTREAYKHKCGGVCERCEQMGLYGVPGEIVHHKIALTPENINNPCISLAFDNLMLLCRDCHAIVHEEDVYNKRRCGRRYVIGDNGSVIVQDALPYSLN